MSHHHHHGCGHLEKMLWSRRELLGRLGDQVLEWGEVANRFPPELIRSPGMLVANAAIRRKDDLEEREEPGNSQIRERDDRTDRETTLDPGPRSSPRSAAICSSFPEGAGPTTCSRSFGWMRVADSSRGIVSSARPCF